MALLVAPIPDVEERVPLHPDRPLIDFTTRWELADAAVRTNNSEELLYVNKAFLAEKSLFFNALFMGNFAEANQEVVNLNVSYETMIEILNILHHAELNYGTPEYKVYSKSELIDLYKADDLFDIPLVKQRVNQQMAHLSPKVAFIIGSEVKLQEEKSKAIDQMPFADVICILKENDASIFSVEDMGKIREKITQHRIEQLDNLPLNEAFKSAVDLGLLEERGKIFEKMTTKDVKKMINKKDQTIIFGLDEMNLIETKLEQQKKFDRLTITNQQACTGQICNKTKRSFKILGIIFGGLFLLALTLVLSWLAWLGVIVVGNAIAVAAEWLWNNFVSIFVGLLLIVSCCAAACKGGGE